MKTTLLRVAAGLLLAGAVASCSSTDTTTTPSQAGTTYGAKAAMGQDTVRTYSVTNDAGVVTEFGITFGAKALDSIVYNNPPGAPEGSTFMLAFPSNAPAPFTFAMIDWNPN